MDDRDAVGRTLLELVKREATFTDDPKRCEALLRARNPGSPRLVSVLVAAAYARMPQALRQGMRADDLMAQLQRYTGVDTELAAWAIGAWARAVGAAGPRSETGGPSATPRQAAPVTLGPTFITRLYSVQSNVALHKKVKGMIIVSGPGGTVTGVNFLELSGLPNLARRQAATLQTEPGYRELGLGPIPAGPHGHVGLERTYLSTRGSSEPVPWLQRYFHRATRGVVLIAPESLRWLVDEVQVAFEKVEPVFNIGLRIPIPEGFAAIERLETSPPRAASLVAASRQVDGGVDEWLRLARENAAQAGGPQTAEEPGITLLGGAPGHLYSFGMGGSGRPLALWAGGRRHDRCYFVTVVKPFTSAVARQYLSWFQLR